MKLLGIKSLVSNVGASISLRDVKGRLSKFFIWNEIDGGFLKFTVPRGEAQAGITPRRLQVVDYLETDIGIPVFSRKAKDRLLEVAPGEVEFYECVVVCKGEEYSFFLGKILKYLPLIDEQRSTFRLLAEGERLLDDAVYKDGTIAEFYMARDREFCERLVVSSQFVELCKQGGLEVGFSKP